MATIARPQSDLGRSLPAVCGGLRASAVELQLDLADYRDRIFIGPVMQEGADGLAWTA